MGNDYINIADLKNLVSDLGSQDNRSLTDITKSVIVEYDGDYAPEGWTYDPFPFYRIRIATSVNEYVIEAGEHPDRRRGMGDATATGGRGAWLQCTAYSRKLRKNKTKYQDHIYGGGDLTERNFYLMLARIVAYEMQDIVPQ